MTKKHFERVAEILYRTLTQETDSGSEARSVVRMIARDLADAFAEANPRFDRERFLKASGVSEG